MSLFFLCKRLFNWTCRGQRFGIEIQSMRKLPLESALTILQSDVACGVSRLAHFRPIVLEGDLDVQI